MFIVTFCLKRFLNIRNVAAVAQAPQPHTQSYSVVASDPEKKPVLTKTGTSCGKKFPKEAESIDVLSAEYGPAPLPSRLSLEERYKLCLSVAEECIQPEVRRIHIHIHTMMCYTECCQ